MNRQNIIQALINNYGYSQATAEELIAKHIDIVEINEDDCTPEKIAQSLEEANMQDDE